MNLERAKNAIVFATHREQPLKMLRAFFITVFLLLFITGTYCHAQSGPEIATIYISDSKHNPEMAIKQADAINDPIKNSFSVALRAYLVTGTSNRMDITFCQFFATQGLIDNIQNYNGQNNFKTLANNIRSIAAESNSGCSNLNAIPLWHIVIFKSSGSMVTSLCAYLNNDTYCAEPDIYYKGASEFLKKIEKACNYSDMFEKFAQDASEAAKAMRTILRLRIRKFSIRTVSRSHLFEVGKPATTCVSCLTNSQNCENIDLEVGTYELSAGWFNRIEKRTVVDQPGLSLSEKSNRLSFTIPIAASAGKITISDITPHHRRRAGVGVLASVLVFAALTGTGFLSTDIYNPCLSSPESLPTYRCIGTSGSQLTKQVTIGAGISGMLVGFSVGIPLIVVK